MARVEETARSGIIKNVATQTQNRAPTPPIIIAKAEPIIAPGNKEEAVPAENPVSEPIAP